MTMFDITLTVRISDGSMTPEEVIGELSRAEEFLNSDCPDNVSYAITTSLDTENIEQLMKGVKDESVEK